MTMVSDLPEPPWPAPEMADDVCPECGRDSCEGHHLQANTEPPLERPRLPVHRATDLLDAPRPVEIIEGVAFADSLSMFIAESGGGKTFVALDMAGAVSDGLSWHGRAVQQGSAATSCSKETLSVFASEHCTTLLAADLSTCMSSVRMKRYRRG